MSTRFGRAMERLHRVGSARLHDSIGEYRGTGVAPVCGIELVIDRDLRELGAEDAFLAGAVLIEYNTQQLRRIDRGGVFLVGGERFVVERPLSDDGHRSQVLCMVAR